METVVISPRKRLQDLTGEWKGAGTMDVAGDSFPVTARWLCESSAAVNNRWLNAVSSGVAQAANVFSGRPSTNS